MAALRRSAAGDSDSGAQFASQLSELTVTSSSRRVTDARAAHATLSATAPVRSSAAGDSNSGAQFASQLSGLTAGTADAGAWRSAGPANLRETAENAATAENDTPISQTAAPATSPAAGTTLLFETPLPDGGTRDSIGPKTNTPKSPARQNANAGLKPSGSAASKHAATGQSQAQNAPRSEAASGESTQTAVAVSPAPEPETAATLPAATDDPLYNDAPDSPVTAATPRRAPGDAAEPAAPTVTTAAGPAQPAQEMAFAARVQPVQSVDHAALPAEMASAAAVASASKKVVAAADSENAAPANAPGLLASSTTPMEPSVAPNRTSSPAAALASQASQHAETSASPTDSLPKASAPLKDISLHVSQPGQERVDVRVVQQGSEVHVSVHSGDASLTSGLRQGLSDLQSRLEENGYRSETWRPGATAAPLAAAPAAQEFTNHSRGGDGQPQHGGSQQDSGRRNQNQQNQPRWVAELESSLTGGEKSSGGFYGFSS